MSITQLRACINGQWHSLTYNPATRAYEADILITDVSTNEPGGVFNVTLEASNDSGVTITTDAENLSGLYLKSLDLRAPVLSLVSPAEGLLGVSSTSILFDAVDDYSGVDLSTLEAKVDGAEAAASSEAAEQGYRITVPVMLADGPHTVSLSVADFEGNVSQLSVAYTVDTTPPKLELFQHRAVVDTALVTLRGFAEDLHGPLTVTISNGTYSAVTPLDAQGAYAAAVPLTVGVNTITVTAADVVGNESSQETTVIRLVTDRTEADAELVRALWKKGVSGMTPEELSDFNEAALRGAYNFTDLNRVGAAVALLTDALRAQGYNVTTSPRIDWTEPENPTRPSLEAYLADVYAVRDGLALAEQELPADMELLTILGANQIEAALVAVDALLPAAAPSYIYSGECFAGEF